MTSSEYSAVLTGVRQVAVQEFDIPRVKAEDALLKVEMVGVCATDAKYYEGKRRTDLFPLILGHEILGHIEEIGVVAQERFKVNKGDRVVVDAMIPCGACSYCITGNYKFCEKGMGYGTRLSTKVPPSLWGAYGQYMYLDPRSILYKISENVPAEAAVLVNAAISNGIQWTRIMGGAKIGDVVVIQGTGGQGLSCTLAARESGAATIITTGLARDTRRLNLARDFGADYAINVEEVNIVQFVRELTRGKMADVVVDVTGAPQGMITSVDLVKKGGTLVCAGVSGASTVTGLLLDKFVFNEITLKGVFTSNFEAISTAVKLVESRKYPVEKIVSHKFRLEDAEQALRVVAGLVPESYPTKAVIVP